MSSESSDEPSCECCGCIKNGDYFTPYCHARLCNKHEKELMVTECSNENCPNIEEKYCKVCFDLNSVSNRCKNETCNYTWCDHKLCRSGKHTCNFYGEPLMKMSNFIDFSLFKEHNESWCDDEDFMILRNETHEYFIDNEIANVDFSKGIKMIKKAKKQEYKKLKDTFISKYVTLKDIRETVFYKSLNNQFYLFYFFLTYADNLYMIGLLDRATGGYVVIGSQGEHLFIKHHLFNYGDSNGQANCDYMTCSLSDEDKKSCKAPRLNSKSPPKTLLTTLENYFTEICSRTVDKLEGDNTHCTACEMFTDGGACDDGTTCAFCNASFCKNCIDYACSECACCSSCEGDLRIYPNGKCKKCTTRQATSKNT